MDIDKSKHNRPMLNQIAIRRLKNDLHHNYAMKLSKQITGTYKSDIIYSSS